MVLGMKSKHKKGVPIKVNYIVHVQQIRPWPPSESLGSVQTVLLQWENGSNNCGSFLSVAGESNIVFNESFMLSSVLFKKASDKFRKNYVEFSLYEPRKEKVKGQLLGTATVNLADYGLSEDMIHIDAPMTFKKISGNTVHPALALSLEPVQRDSPSSAPGGVLSKEAFLNYEDESEMASWTDDDASSYSSRTTGSLTSEAASASASPSPYEKNEFGSGGRSRNLPSSCSDASPDTWRSKISGRAKQSKFSERSMSYVQQTSGSSASIRSSPSSISFRDVNGKFNNIVSSSLGESLAHDAISNVRHQTRRSNHRSMEDKTFERYAPEALSPDHYRKKISHSNSEYSRSSDDMKYLEDKLLFQKLSEAASQIQVMARSDTLVPDWKGPSIPPPHSNKANLKHAKSFQINGSLGGAGLQSDIFNMGKPQDVDIPNGLQTKGKTKAESERKEPKSDLSNSNEWKIRAEMLEEELRESAAIEVSLYTIVAEHSGTANKVHAPARRLARFYTHAARAGPQSKRASAARAAVSGLVLVSKACASDVPRLTFWLSNTIMLRAIITQTAAELPHSNGAGHELTGNKPSEGQQSHLVEEVDDWEDVMTFIIALEKVESWLFTRIIESLWWQSFTPHMHRQPRVGKGGSRKKGLGMKKTTGKRYSLGNHEHENLSLELWKKAFKDACERLCPLRAAGHECGCLSVIFILVIEQLVNRLDVAMFNAILRESAEEMPTDPISDPISDANVLPVPPGKSSFTAGAQLKNAIGSWSRWLTDLFGLEDDPAMDTGFHGDGIGSRSYKAFRLLHALSDLMMIPFGILVDSSTRKEVCPAFGPTIIKRVLKNFVPDEFCPEPIPRSILNSLDSEDITDQSGAIITSLPCTASRTKYSPPPAALLTCVGEVGHQVLKSSRLSTLKKSYASDDELDEVDSPLTSVVPDSYQKSSALAKLSSMPKTKGGRNVVRYQLLREIWQDDED